MSRPLFTFAPRERIVCAALLGVGLLYHLLFLRTFSHWWFEDDPSLFAFVKTIGNPLRFFFDRVVIAQFGRAFVPMQALSMWCDDALAYRSVRFAQLHQLLVLEATLLLLFKVLLNFRLQQGAAFLLATLWLFLPPVVVVNEFLSARHYLEGFAWSLGALLMAQKIKRADGNPTLRRAVVLIASLLAAAFTKEVFAITVPLAIFFYLPGRRFRAIAWAALALPPFYVLCRLCAVGGEMFYGAPFLGPVEYVRFLARLPYILAGNVGGYGVVAVLASGVVYLAWTRRISLRAVAGLAVCFVSALAVIYPVSFPLSRDWILHGTWYRAPFLLASGMLLTIGYATARLPRNRSRPVIIGALALIVVPGGWVTERKWQIAMRRYRYEGKYYLAHPDRLLYSELPAFWFLPGLDEMYAVSKSHHITAAQLRFPPDGQSYGTIWRYRTGKFVPDAKLWTQLQGRQPNE